MVVNLVEHLQSHSFVPRGPHMPSEHVANTKRRAQRPQCHLEPVLPCSGTPTDPVVPPSACLPLCCLPRSPNTQYKYDDKVSSSTEPGQHQHRICLECFF